MPRFLLRMLLLIGVASAIAIPAMADTVTFETATYGPDFTGPVTEAGFTYSTLSGSLFVDASGNPGQDMEGCDVCGGSGGVLQIISATAGDFSFDGLDYSAYDPSDTGTQTLTVDGYLGATLVGTATYTLSNTDIYMPTYANWTTEGAGGLAGDTISSLDIILNASPAEHSSENIDNVVLAPTASAAEPSSLWLSVIGLLAIMALVARSKRYANPSSQAT
jgi:hypothetical protein